ncbi:MAG: ferredoxin family protein [Candidatus Latescibacteria bacterium]|nr:ferredoxin family protein [Candidatus Latescibacterota bacterium]
MAYIIAEPCIDVKDKSCVEVCPVDCIHPTDGEGEPILYIDPDECIDCGACEPECPVEAIFAEEDLPEEWHRFIEINAKYFELKDNPADWAKYKEVHAADFEKKV